MFYRVFIAFCIEFCIVSLFLCLIYATDYQVSSSCAASVNINVMKDISPLQLFPQFTYLSHIYTVIAEHSAKQLFLRKGFFL